MAVTTRAFMLSRVTDLSLKKPCLYPLQPPPRPPPLPFSRRRSFHSLSFSSTATITSCMNGGGVSDDYFVSTRRSGLDQGFSVIANMVNRIEPLDTSVISKGISDSAKDSMKQTISSMLGLLPSDQFSVSVTISKQPLHRLLISSIMTGYTLWNAEYRVSLTRNLDISVDAELKRAKYENQGDGLNSEENEILSGNEEEMERKRPQILKDLSPEALSYIQQLQSELSTIEEELSAKKRENINIVNNRSYTNDLLEYLRSLDPERVTELSRPSSPEVEEIIHQLALNVLQILFKEEGTYDSKRSVTGNTKKNQDGSDETSGSVDTSRDYLAKLLFWCMLLGHHLRGLENRLHLTCVIGLL